MTTPTPRETVLEILHASRAFHSDEECRSCIAWVEGLQAESDERAVLAFHRGADWQRWQLQGATPFPSERDVAEAEARRLLAEGALGMGP